MGLLTGGRVEKEQGGLVDITYKKVKGRKRRDVKGLLNGSQS